MAKHLNVVTIGSLDSGKSTTLAHLMYQCGGIYNREINKHMEEGLRSGKSCVKYAWHLDRSKVERQRGISIELSFRELHTSTATISFIDAPGHREFIKNTIIGIAQADAAMLVVSAPPNEFCLEIRKDGPIREHALLAKALGVKQLIVCINKMDNNTIRFSETKFQRIQTEVAHYLRRVGYSRENIQFIPVSGWTGDNLTKKSDQMPWWKGPSLLGALDGLRGPHSPASGPLRIALQAVHKIGGIGYVAVGRVESGEITPGMEVVIAPHGHRVRVKYVERHHRNLETAGPGNQIGFNFLGGIQQGDIRAGCVVGDVNDPPVQVEQFQALVIVIRCPDKIRAGYSPMLCCHTAHIACKWESLLQRIERNSGKVVEENPQFLKKGDAGLVNFVPLKPMCVEDSREFASLGRFVVMERRRIVAVGVVKSTGIALQRGRLTKAAKY